MAHLADLGARDIFYARIDAEFVSHKEGLAFEAVQLGASFGKPTLLATWTMRLNPPRRLAGTVEAATALSMAPLISVLGEARLTAIRGGGRRFVLPAVQSGRIVTSV